jgi:HEAT repeat protein
VRFFAALLLFLLVGLHAAPSGAQRRRQRAPQTPTQGAGANANTPASAQKSDKSKRVFVGRSSDTGKGSRQTIKSDNPLNDYSAYRSGDRFFVVLPKADANSIPTNDSGRGFSDMKVQQRGNDVVLSYKVRPGTKPRVEQKFNRLDVVFDAADGSGAPASSNQGNAAQASQQQQSQPAATETRPQGNPVQNAAQNAQPSAAQQNALSPAERRAAERASIERANAERNNAANAVVPSELNSSPGGITQTQLPTAAPPIVTEATPSATAETPAGADQLAQAQPPPTTAAPITTTNTPDTQIGTSLGTVLLRNWPVALTLALLVVGVGLFWAARRSSATGRTPLPAAQTKSVDKVALKGAAQVKLKDASSGSTAGVASAAKPSGKTAGATASTLAASTAVEDASAAEEIKSEEKPKVAELPSSEDAVVAQTGAAATGSADAATTGAASAGAVLAGAALVGAAVSSSGDETATTTEIEPATSADAEQVQIEARRLLDGEAYNRNTLATADVMTRQIVASELLAALVGRNPERRERARKAFIEYGYFNETTHNLHFAAAPAERSAAARSLGHVGDRTATSHLVAALEDPTVEVRRVAVESLANLHDPKAVGPLESLLEREKHSKNKVARKLLLRAIEACREGGAEEAATPVIAAAPVETIVQETAVDEIPSADAATPAPAEESATLAVELPAVAPAETGIEPIVTVAAPDDEAETLVAPAHEASPAEASIEEAPVAEENIAGAEAAHFVQDTIPATQGASAAREEVRAAFEEPRVEEVSDAASLEAIAAPSLEDTLVTHVEETQAAPPESKGIAPFFDVDESAADEAAAEVAITRFEEKETPSPVAHEVEEVAEVEEVTIEATAPALLETEAPAFAEDALAEPARAEAVPLASETALGIEHFDPTFASEDAGADAHTLEAAHTFESLAEAEPRTAFDAREVSPNEDATDAESTVEVKGIEPLQSGGDEAFIEDWTEFDMGGTADVSPAPATSADPGATSIEPFMPAAETPFDDATTPAFAVTELARVEKEAEPPVAEPVAGQPFGAKAEESFTPEATRVNGERGIQAFDELSTVPKAIQQRLSSEEPSERVTAIEELSRLDSGDAFQQICAGFDDESKEVRSASARALYELKADRADSFTRALRESDPERRRNIGAAISASGLAGEAISQLTGESRDKTYEAFSLLFLMAKAGEVQPLIRAIEGHPDNEVRLAVVKLLALSGQKEILPAFRRLAVRGSLPTEVRSAVMEAIYQISSQSPSGTPSAA